MIVWPVLLPLIVRLAEMSRSPLALPSPPVGGIVSVNVPAGSTIVSELGLALAAMMADRNEMWPEASLPVLRFTATVSSVVLTWNVERTTRPSSPSSAGRSRRTLALSFRFRKLNMLHPFREMSAHRGRNPKFGSYTSRARNETLRQGLCYNSLVESKRWMIPFWCACWIARQTVIKSLRRASASSRFLSQYSVIGTPRTGGNPVSRGEIRGKSGVGSSFLPEKTNRHRITRKDEPTPDYAKRRTDTGLRGEKTNRHRITRKDELTLDYAHWTTPKRRTDTGLHAKRRTDTGLRPTLW